MKFYRVILFLLLAVLFNQKSYSETQKPNWFEKKRVAFLVGINQYENISSLKFAVSDSNKIRKSFMQVGQFQKILTLNDEGLFETTVSSDGRTMKTVLKDKKLRPTKKEIETQYENLLKDKPEMLLFYYSGHGFIKGDEKSANAIAPSDVKIDFDKINKTATPKNGIVLSDLANKAKEVEQVVFLIDACRSPLPEGDTLILPADTTKKSVDAPVDAKNAKEAKTILPKEPEFEKVLNRFTNYSEKLPRDVEEAGGVVILIGAAPNESSTEDEVLGGGVFTTYLRQALDGEIHKERPEEYVTVSALKDYIEEMFKGYSKRTEKNAQKLYETTNERGRKGDFLISYGRTFDNPEKMEKYSYYNESEERPVTTKIVYDEKNNPLDIKVYSQEDKTNRYYRESLNGIYRVKIKQDRNSKNSQLEYFEAEQFNLQNKSVFTHKMELDPKKGWEYKSAYIPTEEDKKDEQKKKIRYQRKIFDFNGNNLLEEYYDDKGDKDKEGNLLKPLAIRGVATTIRAWTITGDMTLEEYRDPDGNLVERNGYARYAAVYKAKGAPLLEAYYGKDGKLSGNSEKIARIEYTYNANGRLVQRSYYNAKGEPGADETGVSITNYSYDANCLNKEKYFQKELFQTNIEPEKKEQIEEDWNLFGYKLCTSEITHFGTKEEKAGDKKNLHRRVRSFDSIGRITGEDFYRPDGTRWTSNNISRLEYQYFPAEEDKLVRNKESIYRIESKWLIRKTIQYGEYAPEDKPVPASDNLGVHSYLYEYNKDCAGVRKSNIQYRKLLEDYLTSLQVSRGFDCVSRIENHGIKDTLIIDTTGKNETKIYYTDAQQVEWFRENLASGAGGSLLVKTENLFKKGIREIRVNLKEPTGKWTLDAKYILKDGKETLDSKYVYEFNEKGNNTLYAKYILKDGKETLDYKKVYEFNEKGNYTLDAKYILKNGKETLDSKYVFEFNEKGNNTLYAYYILKDGKETLDSKYVYEFNEKGNNTLYAKYILKDGKETLYSKYVYEFNEKGNNTLYAKYILIDGKETLDSKYVYEFNEKGNLLSSSYYNLQEGELVLIAKTYYHPNLYPNVSEEESSASKLWKEKLESVKKNLELDKKEKEDNKTLTFKEEEIRQFKKEEAAAQKELDELAVWFSEQKEFTSLEEIKFQDEDKSHESKFGILFENPQGSHDKRFIRIDLDRFYRPINIHFREGTKTFEEWKKKR